MASRVEEVTDSLIRPLPTSVSGCVSGAVVKVAAWPGSTASR